MSENEQNAIEALAGNTVPSQGEDWKAKYEDMERRYNSARVEEGRVKKLDEALKERDRRIAELESSRRNEDLVSSLSEEERAGIPDEVLSAATKLVGRGMENLKAENDRRFKELEERKVAEKAAYDEDARRHFVERINARYPGFIMSTTAGGDKVAQWEKYQRFNAASIRDAIARQDFDALAYHIEQFYTNHLGVQVPSGEQSGSAAPDPRTSGGGSAGGPSYSGKVYTIDEFNALFEQKEAARDRGDWADVKRISDEINRAQAEGRIK